MAAFSPQRKLICCRLVLGEIFGHTAPSVVTTPPISLAHPVTVDKENNYTYLGYFVVTPYLLDLHLWECVGSVSYQLSQKALTWTSAISLYRRKLDPADLEGGTPYSEPSMNTPQQHEIACGKCNKLWVFCRPFQTINIKLLLSTLRTRVYEGKFAVWYEVIWKMGQHRWMGLSTV